MSSAGVASTAVSRFVAVRRAATAAALAGGTLALLLPGVAHATDPTTQVVSTKQLAPGVVRYEYRYGPIDATPGHNLILAGPVTIDKPDYDGYVTRFKPGLEHADGSVPPIEVLHMHHAVFLNLSHRDVTAPGTPERFYAFGEEKTTASAPPGFGYPVKASDVWAINYMLHNGTPDPDNVYITYTLDYVAANSELGRSIRPVRPVWLDVQNGKAYPVFDVNRGSGGSDGEFTYPDEARDPYPGAKLNQWTVDRPGVLVASAGHVHPGGLYDDLRVNRDGRSTRLFRSRAHYFDPNGPVSWDMAMKVTPDDWRVQVKPGDKLSVHATYDSKRAAWYESMGIMLTYMADGGGGVNPFAHHVPQDGHTTHGHRPEADNHGGKKTGLADPGMLPNGQTLLDGVSITDFDYLPGGFDQSGSFENPPTIKEGSSLHFLNTDAGGSIFHTVTACRAPCTGSTGISYPLATGRFDSGQLGYGPPGLTAAKNTNEWDTPKALPPGTYTYYCRVHPYMRGAFRVLK
jgi:plastocyanin